MSLNPDPSLLKYSLPSRILHWVMALIILFLLGLGIYMTEFLNEASEDRMKIYNLHKSLGVSVLILVFIRIINRFKNKPPTLPESMPTWEKILSHLAHIALYILMIFVPLSGYLMSNSFGFPVHFFSLEMPFLIERSLALGQFFSKMHWLLAYFLLALVALHILAVIKHRFFDRQEHDVLKRML